jgi:hypothetical protein
MPRRHFLADLEKAQRPYEIDSRIISKFPVSAEINLKLLSIFGALSKSYPGLPDGKLGGDKDKDYQEMNCLQNLRFRQLHFNF